MLRGEIWEYLELDMILIGLGIFVAFILNDIWIGAGLVVLGFIMHLAFG